MPTGGSPGRTAGRAPSIWEKLPVSLRAIISGLLLTLIAINVWPVLLFNLGAPFAVLAEVLFLLFFLWWTGGAGPPRSTKPIRSAAFRNKKLSLKQWCWGTVAAIFFAATIHASIVLLFRVVPLPIAAFRHGYDLSFLPSQCFKWLAVLISAISAGICEETGIRGYLQQPIEQRHRAPIAILLSSLFFTIIHLNQSWASPAMVPIVFGAGLLLGLLAWSSRSLIPGMVGHVLMDIGLFAYWWTGIAGDFTARTIAETGVDRGFIAALAAFVTSLSITLLAISKLRGLGLPTS